MPMRVFDNGQVKFGFIDKLADTRTQIHATRLQAFTTYKAVCLDVYPRTKIDEDDATKLSRITLLVFLSPTSLDSTDMLRLSF